MLSNLILLQSISPIVYLILSVQYHATRFAIITACLVWFYCYTVPVECFLMAEALLVEVAGYDVPLWTERTVVRLDIATDEITLESIDLMPLLITLSWSKLRTVAKSLGLTLRTKAAILTALTEEVDSVKVLAAIT